MTSEGLGEMFEGDSADTSAGKFPLVSIGGQAEGLACADPEARTPIGDSGNFTVVLLIKLFVCISCYILCYRAASDTRNLKLLNGEQKPENVGNSRQTPSSVI